MLSYYQQTEPNISHPKSPPFNPTSNQSNKIFISNFVNQDDLSCIILQYNKNDDDNFELQYAIVNKEPKIIK